MKKLIQFLSLLLAAFIAPLLLFAQSVEVTELTKIFDLETVAATLGSLGGAVIVVTQLLKKWFKAESKSAKWLSWAVSLLLSFLCWQLKVGMFVADASWIWLIINGAFAGLIANGLYDASILQAFKEILKKLGVFR